MEDGFLDDGRGDQPLHSGLGSPHCFTHQNGERVERYSRKVFVGGLPPDIDEGIFRKDCLEQHATWWPRGKLYLGFAVIILVYLVLTLQSAHLVLLSCHPIIR